MGRWGDAFNFRFQIANCRLKRDKTGRRGNQRDREIRGWSGRQPALRATQLEQGGRVAHLSYPNDIHQVFYLFEFQVARYQGGFVFDSRSKGKAVSI